MEENQLGDWRSYLNFGIFYYSVYESNTVLYQYQVVNTLIEGNRPYGQAIASKYCRNIVAISGDRAFDFMNKSEEEIIGRINNTGIMNLELAANTLGRLLQSDHIEMGKDARKGLLAVWASGDLFRFLARALTAAVGCPTAQLQKLTLEMKEDILAYRDKRDKTERQTEPSQPVARHAIHAYYEAYELDYEKDRDDFMEKYLRPKGMIEGTMLSYEEILKCTDLFRRANRTFVIDFFGSLPGLSDVVLHRIAGNQCMQILLMGQMRTEKERRALRPALIQYVQQGLTDNGFMHLTYSLDQELNEGEYRLRIIFSVKAVSDEDESRMEDILKPRPASLMPRRAFEGRVPDFLLPNKSLKP